MLFNTKNYPLMLLLLDYSEKIFYYFTIEYPELTDTHKVILIHKVILLKLTERTEFKDLIDNTANNFFNAKSFNSANKFANDLKYLVEILSLDNIKEVLKKALLNRNGGWNQLQTSEEIFLKLYEYSKEKYPKLQENWEKFANEEGPNNQLEFERLQWVVSGKRLEDYFEKTIPIEELFEEESEEDETPF